MMILLAIPLVALGLYFLMVIAAVVNGDRRMRRAWRAFEQANYQHSCPGHCVQKGPCSTCRPEPDINLTHDKETDSWA